MCTQYLREMRFLQSVALEVTPPSLLLPNKTRWRYSVNPCGNSWSVATTPVDEATWHADVLQVRCCPLSKHRLHFAGIQQGLTCRHRAAT